MPNGDGPYAHSRNERSERHDLVAHLRRTGERAAEFAGSFGAAEVARLLGLWHDLGKLYPERRSAVAPAAVPAWPPGGRSQIAEYRSPSTDEEGS